MAVPDWNARARQVDRPDERAVAPVLSLITPPRQDAADTPSDMSHHDSTDTALGAQVAEDLLVVTRVLLGLRPDGAPRPVVAPGVRPVVEVVETSVPDIVLPVVDVVADQPDEPDKPHEPGVSEEPVVATEPAVDDPADPVVDHRKILDELAFLDG